MTDHQIVLVGVWAVTAVCWGTKNVVGFVALGMTAIALTVSFGVIPV